MKNPQLHDDLNSRHLAFVHALVGCLLVLLPMCCQSTSPAQAVAEAGGDGIPTAAAKDASSPDNNGDTTLRNLFLLKLLTGLNLTEKQLNKITALAMQLKSDDVHLTLVSGQSTRAAGDDLSTYAGSVTWHRPLNPMAEARVNQFLTTMRGGRAELIAAQRQVTSAIRRQLTVGQLALIREGAIGCPPGNGLEEVETDLQLPMYDPGAWLAGSGAPESSDSQTVTPSGPRGTARPFAAMAKVVSEALKLRGYDLWRDPRQDHSEAGMLGQLQHFALTLGINPSGSQFSELKAKVMAQMHQMQDMDNPHYLTVQSDVGDHLLSNYRNLDATTPPTGQDDAVIRDALLNPYIITCLYRLSKLAPERSPGFGKESGSSSGNVFQDPDAASLHLLLRDEIVAQLAALQLSKIQCREILGLLNDLVDADKAYNISIKRVLDAHRKDREIVNAWWNGSAPAPSDALTRLDVPIKSLEVESERFREQRDRDVIAVRTILTSPQRALIRGNAAILAHLIDGSGHQPDASASAGDYGETGSAPTDDMDGSEASALEGGAGVLDLMQECREAAPEGSGSRLRVMADTVSIYFSVATNLSPASDEVQAFQRDVTDWLRAVSVMDERGYSQLRASVASEMRRELNLPAQANAPLDPRVIRLLFFNQEALRYTTDRSRGS